MAQRAEGSDERRCGPWTDSLDVTGGTRQFVDFEAEEQLAFGSPSYVSDSRGLARDRAVCPTKHIQIQIQIVQPYPTYSTPY